MAVVTPRRGGRVLILAAAAFPLLLAGAGLSRLGKESRRRASDGNVIRRLAHVGSRRIRMLATMLAAGACVMALTSPAASAAGSVTVTTTLDNVPGSLRDAIAHATPGETVIVPASPLPYRVSGGNSRSRRT